MAGIVVSGGLYSGSGDVITDFFYVMNSSSTGGVKSTVKHSAGTMTLTKETTVNYGSEGFTGYVYNLPREANLAGFDVASGGTILITTTGNTNLYPQYTRHWNFHFSGGANQVINGDFNCSGTITVQKGLVYTNGSSFNNVGTGTVGGCHIVSGTMSGTNISPTFNNLRIDTKGTFKSGAGRKITINSTGPSNQAFVNNGTFDASTGIVSFEGQASQTQKIRGQANDFNIVDVSGASTTVVQGFESGYDDIDIAGALYVHKGKFQTYGDKLHCTGPVVVSGGTLDMHTSDDGSSSHRLASLAMTDAATVLAPPGTLKLNGAPRGGYTMYNPDGTFTHNDGLVAIEFTGTDATQVRNKSGFYDYEQTLGASAHRVNWRGDGSVHPNTFMIERNCTIKEGSFRPTTTGASITISGALEVQSGGNYGYSAGDFEAAATIGSIQIDTGGNMYAPKVHGSDPASGILTITAGNFTDAGTFHHNSGTVVGKAGHSILLLGASNTKFYNIKSASEGSGVSTFRMYTNKTVEHDMSTGSKELQWQLTTNDITLTLGTDSYASQIDADYFDGSSDATTQYVYSASELKPAVFKSSIQYNRFFGHTGQAGYMPTNAHVKWVDVQKDITTPGATKKLIVDDSSKFVNLTLTNGDALHASGTRLETDSLLLDGVFVGSGSLIVANDKLKTNSNSTIYNSGTTTIVGHTGSSTCRWNRGTWDTIMYNGSTGDIQFDTNGNTPTNFIIGNGTLNTKGMHFNGSTAMTAIANGGTLNHTGAIAAGGIYKTTNFNNRGGFFTSSSALSFDGDTNYMKVLDHSSLDFTSNMTLEGWVKSTGTDSFQHIVCKEGGYYFISLYNTGGGDVRAFFRIYEGANIDVTGTTDINDGRWHHVAGTYNSTSMKLYVDGKLEGETANTDAIHTSATNLFIGSNDASTNMLTGDISRVSVWSSALTNKQVRDLMFQDFASATTTNCQGWWQFDEGEGTTVADKKNSNDGTLYGNNIWADMGTWTNGGPLGASTEVIAGNIYLGKHATDATVFASSYFTINNRKLIQGSKMASKSHMGTLNYYIATSGANDYLNYQKLDGAPIGTESEVFILADGSDRSYFSFDSSANNEQTHSLVNAGFVRIVNNSDFYTQDFDNSQGVWIRNGTYGGIIHDDGSTPNEYQPIDIMDDQDSGFDTPELID
tara:strand:- start:1930 stop:5451 length:3522 start_codon:yes stop_codon:yes gene_type:complete